MGAGPVLARGGGPGPVHRLARRRRRGRAGARAARLAASALVLLLPALGSAAEVVFGPRDYVRTGGAANVFTEAFAVCAPARAFRLRAENGPGGGVQVKTASVRVNGAEVVTAADLDSQRAVERPVTLQLENTLTVTLGGSKRGTVRVTVQTDQGCGYDLAVQAPAPGSAVPAGLLLVRGTVTGTGEIGVTVNGELAARDGTAFTALLPVAPDTRELVVTAASPAGPVLQRRQPLTVAGAAAPALHFEAEPAVGAAPLEVRFAVLADAAITHVQLDLESDGVFDYEGPPPDGQAFTYLRAGGYVARVVATDRDGGRHEGQALVQVLDPVAIDQLARARWAALRDALARADVAAAAAVFSSRSREGFREQLTELAGVGALPAIAADLADLRFVTMWPGAAEYDLRITRDGVEQSYWVLFELDRDGIWRLVTF
jgi:hypothetical protein